MTRTLLSAAAILALTIPNTASANDLVKFLQAISGPAPYQHGGHRDYRQAPIQQARSYNHGRHDHGRAGFGQFGSPQLPVRHVAAHRGGRPALVQRQGLSFSVSLGNTAPPLNVPARHPSYGEVAPAPGSFQHLPHQLGEIVTCHVPLETHVRIKDACRIAPNAVPVIVAVRNPHLGRYRSRGCIESLVYVEVLVPPCPPQRVRVSPCRTKVRLDFGKYEVNIVSRNGFVDIDYNN